MCQPPALDGIYQIGPELCNCLEKLLFSVLTNLSSGSDKRLRLWSHDFKDIYQQLLAQKKWSFQFSILLGTEEHIMVIEIIYFRANIINSMQQLGLNIHYEYHRWYNTANGSTKSSQQSKQQSTNYFHSVHFLIQLGWFSVIQQMLRSDEIFFT